MTGVLEWKDTGPLRKDRHETGERSAALYVHGHVECLELYWGWMRSLWARIKGRARANDIIVGV